MDIQLSQILFYTINFGVVVGALTYFLYRPILKIFDERSERINEAQKAAEATIAEKKKLDQIKEESLQQARQEAQEIIENAKQKAKKVEKDILDQAQAKAREEAEKLHSQWTGERDQLAKEMRKQFSDSVLTVVEKVLAKSFDKKTHTKLIDNEVAAILKSL